MRWLICLARLAQASKGGSMTASIDGTQTVLFSPVNDFNESFEKQDFELLKLEYKLAKSEKTLNHLGYIPIVSTFSGLFRVALGVTEVVMGHFYAIASFFQGLWNQDPNTKYRFYRGVLIVVHGQMNATRASLEIIPIVGNILCLFYDIMHRFKYQGEMKLYTVGYGPHLEYQRISDLNRM